MKRYKLIKKYPRLPSDWEEGMEIGHGDRSPCSYYSPCNGKYKEYSILPLEVKMSEFWEEVNDNNPLGLEVGKEYLLQYVHCNSCPQRVKITRFTKDGYLWMEGINSDINGIVSPDCYNLIEEVVEKDYEILSFRHDGSHGVPFNHIVYMKDGYLDSTHQKVPEIHYLNSKCWEIYSVKRLSDGEVFTVGDRVEHQYYKGNPKIEKIYFIEKDRLSIYIGGGWNVSISNIEHIKKPLFTTEDGVDIYEGDEVTSVNLDTLKTHATTPVNTGESLKYGNYKHFSTKEAAEEYILMNKPCLSINDITEHFNTHCSKDTFSTSKAELIKLVKSKL